MSMTLPLVALLVASLLLLGLFTVTVLALERGSDVKDLGAEGDYYTDATEARRVHYEQATEQESANKLKEQDGYSPTDVNPSAEELFDVSDEEDTSDEGNSHRNS